MYSCPRFLAFQFLLCVPFAHGALKELERRKALELEDVSFLRRQQISGDGDGENDEGTDDGPALNPPANPNDCDAPGPSIEICVNLAQQKTDRDDCWNCYPTYREKFCKEEAMSDGGPSWIAKCALEKSVRDLYCRQFANTKSPTLQEECFYKDSEYKVLFCLETQKSNPPVWEDKCCQDPEQGPDYCTMWAPHIANTYGTTESDEMYLKCKAHPTFNVAYCEKMATDSKWDSRCADVGNNTGSVYCQAFITETEVKQPCAQHDEYLENWCTARANAKAGEELCATTDTVKVSYCSVLAAKKIDFVNCWEVESYPEDYCKEAGYASNSKCSINQSPPAPEETSAEARLAQQLEAKGELPANYYSNASLNAQANNEVVDASILLRDRSNPNEGDVPGMDSQLPLGWRSGWDETKSRYFYFPVEEDIESGDWKPVEGADEVYEKPEVPWRLQKDIMEKAQNDEIVMAVGKGMAKPASHSGARYFPSKPKRTNSLIRSESAVLGINSGAALLHEKRQTKHAENSGPVSRDDSLKADDVGQGAAFREAVLQYDGGFPAKVQTA